jgi:hypothetical protein
VHARTHEHSGGVIHREIYQMASYIQILTSRLKSGSSANTPSPTYAPIPPPVVIETPPPVVIETPPPVVIETPLPVAPEVVEAPVEVPTVEETPAPSDENLEEPDASQESPDSEIV